MKVREAIKNKWEILRGKSVVDDWVIQSEAKKLEMKQNMMAEAAKMKIMADSQGWEMLTKYWDNQIDNLHRKLEQSDDVDARAEIRHIRKTKAFVQNFVNKAEALSNHGLM